MCSVKENFQRGELKGQRKNIAMKIERKRKRKKGANWESTNNKLSNIN